MLERYRGGGWGEVITAELPVLYTLRMPYTLRLGEPVQLQVTCGKSASVKFLIGNTFLKHAVATLSYATHTLRCENLSSNHVFPLIYKATTLSIPDVARLQGANLARDAEVVNSLDLLLVCLVSILARVPGCRANRDRL